MSSFNKCERVNGLLIKIKPTWNQLTPIAHYIIHSSLTTVSNCPKQHFIHFPNSIMYDWLNKYTVYTTQDHILDMYNFFITSENKSRLLAIMRKIDKQSYPINLPSSYLVITMDFPPLPSAPSTCRFLLSAKLNFLMVSSSSAVNFSFIISRLFFAIRSFSEFSAS